MTDFMNQNIVIKVGRHTITKTIGELLFDSDGKLRSELSPSVAVYNNGNLTSVEEAIQILYDDLETHTSDTTIHYTQESMLDTISDQYWTRNMDYYTKADGTTRYVKGSSYNSKEAN